MRFIAIFSIVILAAACGGEKPQKRLFVIEGETMGTYYRVSYVAPDSLPNLKYSLDSLLDMFNQSLSTYRPDSRISKINRSESNELDTFLQHSVSKALELCSLSGGDFDITVAPIVNAYGFGFKKIENVTDELIDSLMQFVGCEKISIENGSIKKLLPGIMMDFNAMAPGYAVDLIGEWLTNAGIENWLVDIGGELKAQGTNLQNGPWRIEIETPEIKSTRNEGRAIISITNRALATSGNYRKTYEKDGKIYAHTINPKTGKPALNDLLSATILAPDAETADALATTCMVKGLNGAIMLMNTLPETDWYFIYRNAKGKMADTASSGLIESIKLLAHP